MYIDQTRLKAFWGNPELFRINYMQNLTWKEKPQAIQRGSAMHILAETNGAATVERFREEGLNDEAIVEGRLLWERGLRPFIKSDVNRIVDREVEFRVDIPGTRHGIVGRRDALMESPEGERFVDEYKSADPSYTKLNETIADWEQNPQAAFLAIGAGVSRVRVVTVLTKKGLGEVWSEPFLTIDQFKKDSAMLTAAQTCDIIEMLSERYGIDQPWPHMVPGKWSGYRCRKGTCEFAKLCGQPTSAWPEDLSEWGRREEHLECMK